MCTSVNSHIYFCFRNAPIHLCFVPLYTCVYVCHAQSFHITMADLKWLIVSIKYNIHLIIFALAVNICVIGSSVGIFPR